MPTRDPDAPPGWDYNPASWPQRLPIAGLAVVGFFIAGYLALYQFRVVSSAWDPFFGDGTETVLDSPVSEMFPIPDALLGALGYLADAIAGVVGGRRRWQSWPWLVLLFGLLIGPLGGVSVALVVAQPLLVKEWCTLCLVTAVISVVMIGPAMDEILASLQYLRREYDRGHSVWWAFWGYGDDERAPDDGQDAAREPQRVG